MADNVTDVLARWKRGMTAAAPKIREKVMAMTANPMLAAAANKDGYVNGIMAAVESGKWEAGLRAVDFQAWKQKTAEVGSQRIAAGVEASTAKMQSFFTQLLPYTDAVKQMAASLPASNLEERIAKSVAVMRKMAEFKYRKTR